MTPNEYQQEANRTCLPRYKTFDEVANTPTLQHLIHAHLGMSSEVGEVGDAIKKCVIYGQPLDFENIDEELGDILWYVALAASAIGISLEDIMRANIEKLKIRYPEKFTEEHAALRLDKQPQQ
jgi:NTP pyrophosphatase (non-canonical NTP hydrolase)